MYCAFLKKLFRTREKLHRWSQCSGHYRFKVGHLSLSKKGSNRFRYYHFLQYSIQTYCCDLSKCPKLSWFYLWLNIFIYVYRFWWSNIHFTGCCFVTFYTRKAALEAQNALHNIKTLPGVSSTISFSVVNTSISKDESCTKQKHSQNQIVHMHEVLQILPY